MKAAWNIKRHTMELGDQTGSLVEFRSRDFGSSISYAFEPCRESIRRCCAKESHRFRVLKTEIPRKVEIQRLTEQLFLHQEASWVKLNVEGWVEGCH